MEKAKPNLISKRKQKQKTYQQLNIRIRCFENNLSENLCWLRSEIHMIIQKIK